MNLEEFKNKWLERFGAMTAAGLMYQDAIELLESQQKEIEQLKQQLESLNQKCGDMFSELSGFATSNLKLTAQLESLKPKPKLIGYRNLIELARGQVKSGLLWHSRETDLCYRSHDSAWAFVAELVENSPNIFEPVYEEVKQDYSGLPKIKAGTFFADYIASRNNDKYPNGVIILP